MPTPGPRFRQDSREHATEAEWLCAVERRQDGSSTNGRGLALDFGWRQADIFGPDGLALFCAGERVRALGPDNAITASGRIFARQRQGELQPCESFHAGTFSDYKRGATDGGRR